MKRQMKQIGLIDCNNFFVSCERLFRPDLWKKPVAVLSSNDGCIVARSQEVKDLGIPMGVPYFQVRDVCKKVGVTLFSSNFTLYRDISKRVMHVVQEEFDQCEIYSVDEAFFVSDECTDEAALIAVRERILREVGIPVSIGVGATKTIAKCAAGIAKRGSGVTMLDTVSWEAEKRAIPCGSVWGIGRQTAAKLTRAEVHTVSDFLALDPVYIASEFGVHGSRLRMELSGTPAYGVGEGSEPEQQSIMSSRSFSKATSDKSVLQNAVGYHVTELARKLRKQQCAAGRIYVTARPSRHSDYAYRNYSADRVLEEPTQHTDVLLKAALELLESLYDPEVPYKKAGVSVSAIVPESTTARSLFATESADSTQHVETAVDAINTRYGRGTVRPGVVFNRAGAHVSAALRSQEYTTNWSDIRSIKAV